MIEDILIPDLEQAAATYHPRGEWTAEELAILKRYYGRVPITKLRDHVRHTVDACHRKAQQLGITGRR